jgi:outer membrane protein assembly factor BamB
MKNGAFVAILFRPVECSAGWGCFLAAVTALASPASDWTQFRGPNGSGIAVGAQVPTKWSDTQNLQWKTALPGPGSSSPIVSGEQVFVTCYSGYGDGTADASPDKLQRHLLCLGRSNGKILWDRTVPPELPEDGFGGYLREHGYASSTPVTDGERVYAFFGKTGAVAFDLSGKQLWKVNLGKLSNDRRWGSAASPVLYQNLLIVNAGGESRSIYALDKLSGREVWKAEAETLELCFSTPALVEGGPGRTDLCIAVPGELWGLNPETGKLRWYAQTGIGGNLSPSVVVADGVVFVTGGYPQQGSIAVRCGGKGDVTQTNVAWTSNLASYVPSPIVSGGHLYFVSDLGNAVCLDAKTGTVLHRQRLPGFSSASRGGKPVYASLLLAGGHFYAVTRRQGTFVLKATPEMALVAQNRFAGDESDFNATPAISGNQIFLRSHRYVYCVKAGVDG